MEQLEFNPIFLEIGSTLTGIAFRLWNGAILFTKQKHVAKVVRKYMIPINSTLI
jgi:hypothetical protein